MPRHKRHERSIIKEIYFRTSLVQEVDASLTDPYTKKIPYAGWSKLLSVLLEGWLEGKFEVHIKPFRMNMDDLLEKPR